jgi:hypothetical protein
MFPMDEDEVFAFLKKQKKNVLLDFLRTAFEEMTAKQRRAVFADAIRKAPRSRIDGESLREEIDLFRQDSLAGQFYAPFAINSKNFMHVPEETEEWCDRFARFVADTCQLVAQGEHAQAVQCFAILYQLLEAVDSGEEIIFAEEAGSWMIPTEEKEWLKTYLKALAATATPEEFTKAALPIIQRDGWHSFANKAYASAMQAANPQQKAHLQAELERKKIRTGPTP